MMEEEKIMNELNEEALEDVTGGKKANQKIKATGDLNVRLGPSLDDKIAGFIKKGDKLEFLGVIKADKRKVNWYKVRFNGKICWVSSKYSKIL